MFFSPSLPLAGIKQRPNGSRAKGNDPGVDDHLARWPGGGDGTVGGVAAGKAPAREADGLGDRPAHRCDARAALAIEGEAELDARVSHPGRPAGVRGGERRQLVPPNLVSGSAEDAKLPASDYQKRLPDNTDQFWTSRVRSPDASGRCGLVLDIGGCSG